MSNFKHGGDIYSLAKALNCKPEDIIDFSSNINCIKPEVKINVEKLNFVPYPDKNYTELKQFAGDTYKVDPKQILVFNGGSVAIFDFFRHFSNQYTKAVLHAPLYSEYKRAANTFGFNIELINRFEKKKRKIVSNNSVVVYVHPSTPDALLHPNIEECIKKDLENNCTVLVDESFIEFSDAESLTPLTKEYHNLFILKSMTKFFGTAGIRIGLMISHQHSCEIFKKQEPLWGISLFDAEYMKIVFQNKSFNKISKKINTENKIQLYSILKDSKLFKKIYHSDANFFMCKLKEIPASDLAKRLEPSRILIRDCSNFDFLDDSFVRFSVKDKQSLLTLEKALNE